MRYKDAATQNLPENIRELLKESFDIEKKNFRKGLFITGNTGVGKTYALYAIRNHLKKFNVSCGDIENWVEVLFELKERMNSGSLRSTVNSLTSDRVVFLDDLGAEKQTEWGQEMLYLIINRIYLKGTPLFLTTNLTPEQFSERYGDRLVSRILEICEMVDIKGEDKRTQ